MTGCLPLYSLSLALPPFTSQVMATQQRKCLSSRLFISYRSLFAEGPSLSSPVRIQLSRGCYRRCVFNLGSSGGTRSDSCLRSINRSVGNLDFLPSRYAISPTLYPTTLVTTPRLFPDVVKTRMQLDTGKSQGVNRPFHPIRPVLREEITLTLVVCSLLEASGPSSPKKGACTVKLVLFFVSYALVRRFGRLYRGPAFARSYITSGSEQLTLLV